MILWLLCILKWKSKWSLSCVWLCNPMDCSPPNSSVHGIFQARILEWVAISFSKLSIKYKATIKVFSNVLSWKVYCPSILYEKNYLRYSSKSKEESKEESNIKETVANEMTFMGRKPEQNKNKNVPLSKEIWKILLGTLLNNSGL